MILFYPNENNETVLLLTQRASYNGTHSAQISFPGGKIEKNDKNLEATAFAWLASMRVNKIKFPKSEITGANKSYYLGNIY